MSTKLTFSDHFDVSQESLEEAGFFDISLLSDVPLFIDPFHLFYSDNPEYQELHAGMIRYLVFLRDLSIENGGGLLTRGVIDAYYRFPEIRQTWLGFSFTGNRGHGLGVRFTSALNSNFHKLFRDFGGSARAAHFEKLALIAQRVGKDTISDFTTNLIVNHLATATQEFAVKNIDKSKLDEFTIRKAQFDYDARAWIPKKYMLPSLDGDFVLLTPRDLLTKQKPWINRDDLVSRFNEIPNAISDAALREQLSSFFRAKMVEYAVKRIDKKTDKEVLSYPIATKKRAVAATVVEFPQAIDVYIGIKENEGDTAVKESEELVLKTDDFLQNQFRSFVEVVGAGHRVPTSYEEALARAQYFKECIEQKDGYLNLYVGDSPADEDWVQRMFWFTWFGANSDVNRDPSNGRGRPDYTASIGKFDKSLVEFKLAKSTSLEDNILEQLEMYKKTNKAKEGIWVIVCYSSGDWQRAQNVLQKHGVWGNKNYIVVDARKDNKTPASKIKAPKERKQNPEKE